ncbi:MAG: hypothetical protein AABM67_10785 [Acidobacteriota bacterium]
MLRRYTFWLWAAVVVMFLTAAVHSITLFISPAPQNEVERQLFELMRTYRPDLGPIFHPTWANLSTALSSCFSLLCVLGGLINAYLLKKKAGPEIMKGIVLIDLFVFAICFAIMAILTFLPPIVLTGLIVLFLVPAVLMVRDSSEKPAI